MHTPIPRTSPLEGRRPHTPRAPSCLPSRERPSPKGSTDFATVSRSMTSRAGFAKWRATITIRQGHPQRVMGIKTNAHALAGYAALCRRKLVSYASSSPIGPYDGGDPSLERSFESGLPNVGRGFTLSCVTNGSSPRGFAETEHAPPGYDGAAQASDEEIAHETIRCFMRHVPQRCPASSFSQAGSRKKRRRAG